MRAIFIFCLCLITTSCYAGELIADPTTGCKIWTNNPDSNKFISWSGKCEGGMANGKGVLRAYKNKPGTQGNSKPYKMFEGYLKDGKLNGNGTFTNQNGVKMVGEWKDGKLNGKGTFSINGDQFDGEWKDGKRDGNGTQTFANGVKYVGEWKNDKWDGKGTGTFANGETYVGEWKDGKRDGNGTQTFANGVKYVGEWKNDKWEGKGTLTWANGDTYVGEWKDRKMDGNGTFTKANGEKYVGEWWNGKRDGKGTLIWADGTKYVGDFKDDNPKGKEIQPLTHSISEEDACNMAIDYFNKHEKQGMMCGNKRMPDDKIAGSCKDFLSNSEQGWAKISVPFEAFGCYPGQEHMHGTSPFTFQRFDQGWMITR